MKIAGIEARLTAAIAALGGALVISAPVEIHAQESINIEEIVVTARKKDESLQEVPVAVSAITADMVNQMGLRDLTDIAKVTAGLSFDPEFNRTSNRPVIRGQANILADSGVSYFIDDVYITWTGGGADDFNDRWNFVNFSGVYRGVAGKPVVSDFSGSPGTTP